MVALVDHDVRATLGRGLEPQVREIAQGLRAVFDEHADQEDAGAEPDPSRDLDMFFDRVVEDTQQYLQNHSIHSSWPPCPRHPQHRLWLVDDHWTCKQDGTTYARLGELTGSPVSPVPAPATPVEPGELGAAWVRWAGAHGVDPLRASLREGSDLMLSFYAEVRVQGCDPADDQDMLLVEWGSFDWGDGRAFEVDFSRQLTLPAARGGTVWGLHVVYRFAPTGTIGAIPQGNDWWGSADRIGEFAEGLQANEALAAVAGKEPQSVEIYFEPESTS